MRRLVPLLFIFLALGCAQEPATIRARHIARIEQRLIAPDYAKPVPSDHASINDRLAHWHVAGVSIAVINDGKVEWAKGYGVADLATGRAVDEHTLFHGASLSKPVNAITVLKFVQDGKLELDKDVNAQLKGWKVPPSDFTKDKPITLRRLLSHTAGMSLAAFGPGYPATMPAQPLVDLLNGKPPATQPVRVEEMPGKRFHYSGGAVAISQLMLEEVTGEPYPKIVKENALAPLGMGESTLEQTLSAEQLQHAAPGFKAGKHVNGPERVYPAMSAAGLWTTPSDYCNVIVEIQRAISGAPSKVLSQGGAEVMLTPYIANAKNASKRTSTVGMGVFLTGKGEGRTFFHAGSHAGYACYMVGRLEAGQGVVVMTNGDDAFDLIAEIVQTVASEYGWPDYGFIPPPRPKPATQPATEPVR
jgi:CubicO group peptidase (beta-lactamase class C family)